MKKKTFVCKTCGYVHKGANPPAVCPVCGKPASEFEEVKSKGLNTNSNAYTIIYAAVMVVIVALLLAVVSSALSPKQDANVALDKKKQILAALKIDYAKQDAAALYDQYITSAKVINAAGEVLSESKDEAFAIKVETENGKALEERQLPIYIATIEGETKYVLPLRGVGLWGAIWGYIALDADKNTVYGVNFSHAGETPGLGGEIVTPAFRGRFEGKHIENMNHQFVSIAVMKAGQKDDTREQVDAWAGATITSKGVENMLFESMKQYESFLVEPSATATTAASQNEQE